MRNAIVALWGCIAAAAVSAQDWHVVAHGLSWHEGRRTYTVEEWAKVEGEQVCYKGRCKHGETEYRLQTREVEESFRAFNPGLAVRRSIGADWGVQGGIYLNSYSKLSLYALGEWTPLHRGAWSGGLFAGLVSGYDHGIAAGGLVARWQGDKWSFALRGMPRVSEKQSGAVATIEFGYRM